MPGHSAPFGLIAWLEETRIVLPLKAVDVAFSVSGDLAEVSLDQIFHQTSSRPLDVVYTFPLPAGAAVFRCELIVNDRVIEARVEEKARARQIAHEMKQAGRRVGLVEMERENLFTLSLGNVQPGDLIVVRFAWFQELNHLQDAKSLAIPFTPGLRYIPGKPLLRGNRGKGIQDDTDQVPDASRISPPRIDELHPDAALVSLNGKLDAHFVAAGSLSSPTHPILVRDEKETALVTLPLEGHVPDRDFILRWKERAVTTLDLRSTSCSDRDAQYAVVRLDAPADAPIAVDQSRDYYFLIDRSGSMGGSKWTCTARALNAFVDQLGEQDRVWVTLFESSFQDYAEAPLPAAELKTDPAFRSLEKLGVAGGTELLPALDHVLKKIAIHSPEHEPAIIIITDGQVGNEAAVIQLMRAHPDVTLHTFGIDTAVNDAFLKQLATQHRGSCTLMTPNDDIQGAVFRLGNRLRRPVLTELSVVGDWAATSSRLPDIHAGEHILVALKGDKDARFLELKGKLADNTTRDFRFDLEPTSAAGPRLLWARQTIDRCLAEGRDKEAIQLAIQHNLICRGTAFIAYDLKEKVSLATEEIYQPSMLYAGAMPVSACAPAPPASSVPQMKMRRFTGPEASASSLLPRIFSSKVVARKTRQLFDLLKAGGKPNEREREKMIDIRARHRGGANVSSLRSQILIDAWSARVLPLPAFQSEA
ncbi:MAG TPA: VIT domain-containing protein, partial [Candidatus Methylacidiphilales bacterium]